MIYSPLADYEPSRLSIAIERPHGPVVETLLERQFAVYSINPKQVDRFRDRHSVSGAKDDRRDALVLADSLRTDTKLYRRVALDEPHIIELREWSQIWDELRKEQVRLEHRVRDQCSDTIRSSSSLVIRGVTG